MYVYISTLDNIYISASVKENSRQIWFLLSFLKINLYITSFRVKFLEMRVKFLEMRKMDANLIL